MDWYSSLVGPGNRPLQAPWAGSPISSICSPSPLSEAPEQRETETGLSQGPALPAPPSVSTPGQPERSLRAGSPQPGCPERWRVSSGPRPAAGGDRCGVWLPLRVPQPDTPHSAGEGGAALYSQQKRDRELTVAQTVNPSLPNSDLD